MGAGERSRAESPKGRRRREQLVEAAAAVLLSDGPAGLSHRAVAARAGLPLAATTYYFDSLEDLLEAAMRRLADGWISAAQDAISRLPDALENDDAVAGAVVAVVTASPAGGPADREALLVVYERYVEAGRHPRLAGLVTEWNAEVEALLADLLRRGGVAVPGERAGTVLALADGALVRALGEGRGVDSVLPVIAGYLGTLPRQEASGGSAGRRSRGPAGWPATR